MTHTPSIHPHDHGDSEKGPSLARGPAWIIGLVISIAGLALFFRAPGTPLGTGTFPDGDALGRTFLGFEANAWTAWGTTAAGVLVLTGAAQHLMARTISLVVGAGLAAAAILAFATGDVLGLAAANTWTALAWAIGAGALLVTALLPRLHREASDTTDLRERASARRTDAGAAPAPMAATSTEPAPAGTPATAGVRSDGLRRTYEAPSTTDEQVAAAREAETQASARRS